MRWLVSYVGDPFNSTADRLAQSGRVSHYRAGAEVAGLNPGRSNTQGLKTIEEKVLSL